MCRGKLFPRWVFAWAEANAILWECRKVDKSELVGFGLQVCDFSQLKITTIAGLQSIIKLEV